LIPRHSGIDRRMVTVHARRIVVWSECLGAELRARLGECSRMFPDGGSVSGGVREGARVAAGPV
jgi:hypothetical protein